jgi:hypothetical protein
MSRVKTILGWLAVSITVLVSSIWAYWGAIENFHEGWYSTFWENIGMMLFQYLLFPIIFVALALVILKWKRIGLALHFIAAAFCIWFFSAANFSVLFLLIVLPFIGLGLMYYFGEPNPRKWARLAIIIIPLVIVLGISAGQLVKVSQRIDDGNYNAVVVEGNGVNLTWAPRGPGWPDKGVSWEEANEICKYLSEDGTTIMKEQQNIWRLPTVDEAVRSMMLHGENAGGVWNPEKEQATYTITPDKESPLWDVHSKVVYYWTSETSAGDEDRAYIIVYHGGVHSKMKTDSQDYLSFRAVKDSN